MREWDTSCQKCDAGNDSDSYQRFKLEIEYKLRLGRKAKSDYYISV